MEWWDRGAEREREPAIKGKGYLSEGSENNLNELVFEGCGWLEGMNE